MAEATKKTAQKTSARARTESQTKTKSRPRSARTAGGMSTRSSFFDKMLGTAKTFFEAAARNVKNPKSFDVGPNGANCEIERLRDRSRWIYANDSFYRQGCKQVANNVIHYGIKPVIKDKKLLKLWNRWQKEADSRNRLDFYGQQWNMALSIARDGEAIAQFVDVPSDEMNSRIGFQVKLLEADYMPLDKTELAPGGNWIVSGVEKDSRERAVAYWLYDHHPKDWKGTGQHSLIPSRVSATDVMHVYMPERFSDTRGYPWASSSHNTIDSLRVYDEAELERKKGQSTFGGYFKKTDSGVVEDDGIDSEDELETDENGEAFKPLDPGTFVQLPEGWDIELSQPTATDNNYSSYRREGLSGLAVSLGFAVEHITLNFEKINERQYRAIMLEVKRHIESLQYHMIVRQLCEPVWRRFLSAVIALDLWQIPDGDDIEDWMDIEWMPPARGHIHPVQEIDAFAKAVKNGFTSRKRVAAQFGEDVEDIDAENSEDRARAEKLGISYDVYVEDKLREVIKDPPEMAMSDDDDDDDDYDEIPSRRVPQNA